jgi:hypothetical protein
MKRRFFLLVIMLLVFGVTEGQKSSFYIRAGITNCTTKTMLVPHTGTALLGFDPRIGGLLGGRFDYRLSRYFHTGAELLYLLKGNYSTAPDAERIYSNHYLGLSPYISVFPFINSKNKYISCISPEISFDYNQFLGTDKIWKPFDEVKFYQHELGYTLKLTYQPNKFGVQFFYFRSLTPYYVTHFSSPIVYDYKYSFVSGVSILYKIFTPHSKP